MEKIGDVKVMAWGAAVCIPYICSLLIPAYFSSNKTSTSWIYNPTLVYVLILVFSMFTGIGEGMA